MYRFKRIVGDHLRSRTPERQKTEAMIGVAVLVSCGRCRPWVPGGDTEFDAVSVP
jgi:hypothetical protein